MVALKCKMCGGDLPSEEGHSVVECEYCGTKQTVPKADDEKKLTLFARAGRLLRACEFDKAAGIFESLVADFPEEAETYWGLVLCKYGIEYVDDPKTSKKIPTCHRSSFDSVFDDLNFDQACENADAIARSVYRDEAKAIEELRKGIIEVSSKEEPYDIFICYKEADENGDRTLDSVLAQDIYDALTEKGYRVFFARVSLEDRLGKEYEPYIFAALNSAKIMLAVGTSYEYYNAVWVKNEWSRFLSLISSGEKKTLIPCYKGIDAYDMPKEFIKLSAQDLGKVGAIQDLLRGIEKILGKKQSETVIVESPKYINEAESRAVSILKRGFLALEDGEWETADKFFEEVLNYDAENSDAYFGKYLAENKYYSPDDFESKTINCLSSCIGNPVIIDKPTEHFAEMAKANYVPIYLTDKEILSLYNSISVAPPLSREKSLSEEKNRIIALFSQNKLLNRAKTFGNGNNTQIEKAYVSIISRADEFINKSLVEDKEKNLKRTEEYNALVEKMDQTISDKHEEALILIDLDYEKAKSSFANGQKKQDYEMAMQSFSKLDGYKESHDYIGKCAQRITAINAEVKEATYQDACNRFNNAISVSDISEVIKIFKSLLGYKDSAQLLEKCSAKKNELRIASDNSLYNELCQKQAQSNSFAELRDLQKRFSSLPVDGAIDRATECRDKADDLEYGSDYQENVNKFNELAKKSNINKKDDAVLQAEYQDLYNAFSKYGNYKNAPSYKNKCFSIISKFKQINELKKELDKKAALSGKQVLLMFLTTFSLFLISYYIDSAYHAYEHALYIWIFTFLYITLYFIICRKNNCAKSDAKEKSADIYASLQNRFMHAEDFEDTYRKVEPTIEERIDEPENFNWEIVGGKIVKVPNN